MAETHGFVPLVADATPATATNASSGGGPDVPDVRAVSADRDGGGRGGWQLAHALLDAYDDRPLATIGALSLPASRLPPLAVPRSPLARSLVFMSSLFGTAEFFVAHDHMCAG